MPTWPEETVVGRTGIWATAVWVGKGVNEAVTGATGVLNCDSNEVLVGDGTDGAVDVEPSTIVGGKGLGVAKKGAGVLVRGCRR